MSDDFIVIYPELVFGNPLKAKNVVRWLMHVPGFHSGKIGFGSGELYFDYNNFAEGFSYPGSIKSELKLTVTHYPFEYYNLCGALPYEERSGLAYCIRKGADKFKKNPVSGGVLIDGKSHREVSEILKRVRTFVSYDSQTAYSKFAVLCGADSIVVPDEGVDKYMWRLSEEDRYGIAYGFDEVESARLSAFALKDAMSRRENECELVVSKFAKEAIVFFSKDDAHER